MAVMVTGWQIYLTYKSEMTALRDRFDQIEKSYIPSLKEAMWAVDEQRINVLLDGLAALPGIGSIILLDDIGTRWQRNNTSGNQAADSRSFTLQYHIGNDQYLLGELQVTLMDDAIYQSLKPKRSLSVSPPVYHYWLPLLFCCIYSVMPLAGIWKTWRVMRQHSTVTT